LDLTLSAIFLVTLVTYLLCGKIAIGEHKIFAVLSLPVIFSVFSMLWSVNLTETLKSIVVYGAALATFLITATLFREFSAQSLARLFLIIPIMLISTALLSYVPSSPIQPEAVMPSLAIAQDGFLLSYKARFSHPFLGLSNSFATILAMLLPLVVLVRKLGFWPRRSWWIAIITFSAIISTGSRGVIASVLLGYCFSFLGRLNLTGRLRLPRKTFFSLIAAMIFATGFVFLNPNAQKHLMDRLSVVNIVSRLNAFIEVFALLDENPTGIGSGVSLSDVSGLSLRSVHNAYLQNFLWFGLIGGTLTTLLMWALPLFVLGMRMRSVHGLAAKRGLAMSVLMLLLINMSQASWEGSVIRLWIYFLIAVGVIMVRKADSLQ